MQYTEIFLALKIEIFRENFLIFFLFLLKKIKRVKLTKF